MMLPSKFNFLAFRALLAGTIVFLAGCARFHGGGSGEAIRIATYNIEELSAAKLDARDEQVLAAAQVVKVVRPDVLVLNEIDFDEEASDPTTMVRRFNQEYLKQGTNILDYPYAYAAPSNTGVLAHHDFNNDGITATSADRGQRQHGDDSFGYGIYPGQYAMGLLSKYPLKENEIRTFQKFLWKELPGNHLPAEWYSAEEQGIFRLSSKSHWDVPIEVNGQPVHLLISHPTPPAFDGNEDRNGRRNHDEIKFWVHYLNDDPALHDDRGKPGGLKENARFIIAGDLNASPLGEAVYDGIPAIGQLLGHPRIQDTAHVTRSEGAPAERPDATAEFLRGTRVDYVLPSTNIQLIGGGVFWPSAEKDPEAAAIADKASDHRMVYIDIRL